LKSNHIKTLIDISLNNTFQLVGYAKKEDLPYFLQKICGAEYRHLLFLAPTKDKIEATTRKGAAGRPSRRTTLHFWRREEWRRCWIPGTSRPPQSFCVPNPNRTNATEGSWRCTCSVAGRI
jgi:hypothetical protein